MNENSEIVNLIISISFFLYFLYFIRKSEIQIDFLWIAGMISIILSNTFTIVEEYYCNTFFNFMEHVSYTFAALLFLIGAIRLKTY